MNNKPERTDAVDVGESAPCEHCGGYPPYHVRKDCPAYRESIGLPPTVPDAGIAGESDLLLDTLKAAANYITFPDSKLREPGAREVILNGLGYQIEALERNTRTVPPTAQPEETTTKSAKAIDLYED
jgi:hypothetical protein